MEEIVSNSKIEEGNTQIPSSTPKLKQVPARIHHFFTYNNYDSKDINVLTKLFDVYCYMYAFQEELGEGGTPHLQGIISCHKPTRSTVFGNKKIHWEFVGDVKASYVYCTKSDTRNGGVFLKKYTIPYTFRLDNLYDWQKILLTQLTYGDSPHDRQVNWYWSTQGKTGKSSFCKHLVFNYNAVFLSKGKYNDIINIIHNTDMVNKNIVVIDLPRNNGNKVSYDAIESIKNGLICNTKFETGSKGFAPPHIVVFANSPPDLDKLSNDRWNVVNIDPVEAPVPQKWISMY